MANTIFQSKRIVLGVTGSIACYKAIDLASKLTQAGAHVDVIMTDSACRFVKPLSFSSVTGQKTSSDMWSDSDHVQHIEIGESADLFVIAPATAHTIAKMAHGLADNLLTLTFLAARCPIMVAPAMDGGMYGNPVTQANIDLLQSRGVIFAGPTHGRMASGLSGLGRMIEPSELSGHVRYHLGRNGLLRGKRVVVTAGPTQEPLDPVRYLSNRSSGKQGIALAQAAIDAGAQVDLISGPVDVPILVGANHIPTITAMEMHNAVLDAASKADILLMAAAVADYRPANVAPDKIKKSSDSSENMNLSLDRNPDILMAVKEMRKKSGRPTITLGFAAETSDVLSNGQDKMDRKGLDFIAINDVSASDAGFAVDTNRLILLSKDGHIEKMALQSKSSIAESIIEIVAKKFH